MAYKIFIKPNIAFDLGLNTTTYVVQSLTFESGCVVSQGKYIPLSNLLGILEI